MPPVTAPAPDELTEDALSTATRVHGWRPPPVLADVRASCAAGHAVAVVLTVDGRDVLIDENGHVERAPAARANRLARRLRELLADRVNNPLLAPLLHPLIGAWHALADTGTDPARVVTPGSSPGAVAHVYSMGRWRRGLLLSVAPTRATVAFATGANPCRVHRKTTHHAHVFLGAGRTELPDLYHP